jgi:isoleucyl-tRNA synthetase
MKDQISDELNVLELEDIAHADGDLVDISVKANFKTLGAKYGKAVQDVATLIAAADATSLVKGLRTTGTAQLDTFAIELEDLVVTEVPKSGWMVASHDGESVALDLALTPELIASGQVREVIRLIQERRKSDGFEITDRISVRWNAPEELVETITQNVAHISDEVLALSFERDRSVAQEDNQRLAHDTMLKNNGSMPSSLAWALYIFKLCALFCFLNFFEESAGVFKKFDTGCPVLWGGCRVCLAKFLRSLL